MRCRLLAASAALLCLAAHSHPPAPVRVERTVFLMGTAATLVAEAPDRAAGLAQLERMVRVIEATEAELSTWRDDSVLSRLNRQPLGAPRPVPPSVCGLLGRLAAWRQATGGAFDPAVGRLVEAWGLREAGRRPAPAALAAARARTGLQHLTVDREACTVARRADVTLDAGGFGKGEALDRVRDALREPPGAWLVDFGGQVAVSGAGSDGAWPVAIAYPERRGEAGRRAAPLRGSLATSGGSERDLAAGGGERIGHILDPRSGEPVGRGGSVVVWHRDAFAADVLSTALHVMGPEAGLAWAAARGIAACFLQADAASARSRSGLRRPSRHASRCRGDADPPGRGVRRPAQAPGSGGAAASFALSRPNSTLRRYAASTAFEITVRNAPFSSW